MRFGKLTVIDRADDKFSKNGSKYISWNCICDCGNRCVVKSSHLLRGSTKSCGCLQKNWNKENKSKTNTYDLSGEYGIGYTENGEEFYFDLEDYEKIKDYCWSTNTEGYLIARDKSGSGKCVKIHQIIMGDKHIDHIKHNKLDNRKSQLRKGNDALNSYNRETPLNNTSGCKGVCWRKKHLKWEAYITYNKKWVYLGMYQEYEDAVAARKAAEEKYFGEWSYDNSMKLNEDVSIKNDQEVMI